MNKVIPCDGINVIVDAAEKVLLDHSAIIEVKGAGNPDVKRSMLPSANTANMYAIFEKEYDSADWKLVYIGVRQKKAIRQRLSQHFFKCHKGTESKLDKVIQIVSEGHMVGLTAALLDDDLLRTSIESHLIERRKPEWNVRG